MPLASVGPASDHGSIDLKEALGAARRNRRDALELLRPSHHVLLRRTSTLSSMEASSSKDPVPAEPSEMQQPTAASAGSTSNSPPLVAVGSRLICWFAHHTREIHEYRGVVGLVDDATGRAFITFDGESEPALALSSYPSCPYNSIRAIHGLVPKPGDSTVVCVVARLN